MSVSDDVQAYINVLDNSIGELLITNTQETRESMKDLHIVHATILSRVKVQLENILKSNDIDVNSNRIN